MPVGICTGLQLLAGEWSAQKLSPIPVPESLQVDTKISNEVKDFDQKSLPGILDIKSARVYYSFLNVLCASNCTGLDSVTHLGKSKTAVTCKIINLPTCPLIRVGSSMCTQQKNPPQKTLVGLLFRLF